MTRRVPVRLLLVMMAMLLYVAVVSSIALGPMDIGFMASMKA
ncbi:hypothetical protein JCM19237_5251 [Photobacterium aphoticum]|nr:hypothetical protein JCM19237_5251 [Photobacterium aphoticum]